MATTVEQIAKLEKRGKKPEDVGQLSQWTLIAQNGIQILSHSVTSLVNHDEY